MSANEVVSACGTYAGYQAHRRGKSEPCNDCRRAQRDYMRAYRAKSAEARDRDYRYSVARSRAVQRLIALHPAQFEVLLAEERDRA